MKKLLIAVFALTIFLAACGFEVEDPHPTPVPPEMSWEEALVLLHSGDVEAVAQLHNLTVYLTLTDGQQTQTTEPTIDAIFDEIQKCGAPCSVIAVMTE